LTDPSRRAFGEPPKLDREIRQSVLNLLTLEIDELERLTERDLSHWRTAI
jgi:hypothetical protein